ncbi:uncharacterized protein [Physeter macrocephalus]|uniref:Uncharacterized protein isoform X5 n=1 Tax=Physeter macrocephalus TaxID=9755 RepID=A0A455C0M0_PHYMC|nr:uncharacterized protein LOC114487490 isoform X5 [Physeter catodon]|eukprot:XP_028353543.1 uncharacterized protein LOC114487490 isoform X4 [Physeter catodon]
MGASPVVFAWSHGAANGNQLGRCGPSTDEVAVQWKTGQAGQELHRYTGLQYPRSDEEVAVMLGARLIGVTAKHPEGKTPDEVKALHLQRLRKTGLNSKPQQGMAPLSKLRTCQSTCSYYIKTPGNTAEDVGCVRTAHIGTTTSSRMQEDAM